MPGLGVPFTCSVLVPLSKHTGNLAQAQPGDPRRDDLPRPFPLPLYSTRCVRVTTHPIPIQCHFHTLPCYPNMYGNVTLIFRVQHKPTSSKPAACSWPHVRHGRPLPAPLLSLRTPIARVLTPQAQPSRWYLSYRTLDHASGASDKSEESPRCTFRRPPRTPLPEDLDLGWGFDAPRESLMPFDRRGYPFRQG
jgi:hypothetical protein